jgi:cell division protein ZapA (FtsZ GTPase activity inhibitor)
MEKAAISVKIYNNTYTLRTSAAQEDVLQVAQDVDSRMQSLSAAKNIMHTEKLAIWTALDLAADLQAERRRSQELALALKVQQEQNQALAQELEDRRRQDAEHAANLQAARERCHLLEKALQKQQDQNAQAELDLQEIKERYERLLAAVRER